MGTNSIEYTRQYYEKNKERIQKQMSEHITCSHCYSIINKSHINRHMKTLKCKNYVKVIEV